MRALERIVAWGVPTVILGGARQDNLNLLLEQIRAALEAGARGVVIGRNVWQSADMENAMRRLQELL